MRLLLEQLLSLLMLAERQAYLQAEPYQRTPERRDQANGYKPKTLKTRLGPLALQVPQVRKGPFYPSVLTKGLRSEHAMWLVLAEMYVYGVSTRKVAALVEEVLGLEGSSSTVSRAAQALNETLFAFPEHHRRRLRTNNVTERLTREMRRRARVVSIFPNEAACLRLMSAVLMEQDEAWATGRPYLRFEETDER